MAPDTTGYRQKLESTRRLQTLIWRGVPAEFQTWTEYYALTVVECNGLQQFICIACLASMYYFAVVVNLNVFGWRYYAMHSVHKSEVIPNGAVFQAK
jgi:hypothetical protein